MRRLRRALGASRPREAGRVKGVRREMPTFCRARPRASSFLRGLSSLELGLGRAFLEGSDK